MIDESSDDELEPPLPEPDEERGSASGPTALDLVVIGAAMLGSLVLFAAGFIFLRDVSDLGDSVDTARTKAAICQKGKAPPIPTGTSTALPQAGTTQVFDGGEEPPLLVELRSFSDGKASVYTRLGAQEILPSREVTVMNLWATWCHPCVSELPAFRTLFESHGDWKGKAAFLPVLTQDPSSVEAAYRDFKDKMPAFRRFLVEFGGFTEGLEKKQMWKNGLPVTLVIGCRQRVRWAHFGELGPPEIAELESTVSKLLLELDSAECRKDVAVCGDGRCNGMENKVTCKQDCPADMVTCGDGVCDKPEDKEKCPQDCGNANCGNGICGEGETFKNCPKDCRGKCPKDFRCKSGFKCDSQGWCVDPLGFKSY